MTNHPGDPKNRVKYNYHVSTLKPDEYLETLNKDVREFCAEHPITDEASKQLLISRLLRRSGVAAFQGASRLEGGPFGAMLVDFSKKVPEVVGFGTNHVVPNSDPSAHAEMTAIRDTAKRLGRTDLKGLTLVTSCECCPMCLSAATGCRVDKIYFAATREDAAKVGFSDEDQYRLMKSGNMDDHASKVDDRERGWALLNGHDAVVTIHHEGKSYHYYGSYKDANRDDPTSLPVVQAIQKACAGLADMKGEPIFHLPEDTEIVSRDRPHPLSLVAADWARIGRRRGTDPTDPAQDDQKKDTTKIQYVADTLEDMTVHDAGGVTHAVKNNKVWKEIQNPKAIHIKEALGKSHKVAFEEWDRLTKTGFMPRY